MGLKFGNKEGFSLRGKSITQGTTGHTSALKVAEQTKMQEVLSNAQAQQKPSPAQHNKGGETHFHGPKGDEIKSKKELKKKDVKTKTTVDPTGKITTTKTTSKTKGVTPKKAARQHAEEGGDKKSIRKTRRDELKEAKKTGRKNRGEEKHQMKMKKAMETQDQRLDRRKARNERIGDALDIIFDYPGHKARALAKKKNISKDEMKQASDPKAKANPDSSKPGEPVVETKISQAPINTDDPSNATGDAAADASVATSDNPTGKLNVQPEPKGGPIAAESKKAIEGPAGDVKNLKSQKGDPYSYRKVGDGYEYKKGDGDWKSHKKGSKGDKAIRDRYEK
mgnify:CR=1 FL=1